VKQRRSPSGDTCALDRVSSAYRMRHHRTHAGLLARTNAHSHITSSSPSLLTRAYDDSLGCFYHAAHSNELQACSETSSCDSPSITRSAGVTKARTTRIVAVVVRASQRTASARECLFTWALADHDVELGSCSVLELHDIVVRETIPS